MRIREVRIERGFTVSITRFESYRTNFAMSAELDAGDDLVETIEAVSELVNERLIKDVEEILGDEDTKTS